MLPHKPSGAVVAHEKHVTLWLDMVPMTRWVACSVGTVTLHNSLVLVRVRGRAAPGALTKLPKSHAPYFTVWRIRALVDFVGKGLPIPAQIVVAILNRRVEFIGAAWIRWARIVRVRILAGNRALARGHARKQQNRKHKKKDEDQWKSHFGRLAGALLGIVPVKGEDKMPILGPK